MLNSMTPFTFLYWKIVDGEPMDTTETGVLMIGEANEGSDTSVYDFESLFSMAITLL